MLLDNPTLLPKLDKFITDSWADVLDKELKGVECDMLRSRIYIVSAGKWALTHTGDLKEYELNYLRYRLLEIIGSFEYTKTFTGRTEKYAVNIDDIC